MDNLFFVIQVKERNPQSIKSETEENKWFEDVVLKYAKKQIKDSLNYFTTYEEIKIKNLQNHTVDVSKANLKDVNKVIIYSPNSFLISQENQSVKFVESKLAGNIHLFKLEDYFEVYNKQKIKGCLWT